MKTKSQIDIQEFTFEEFQTVIRHSSVISRSEETFEMISSWIKSQQDDDKKQQHFDELIQFVDFDEMARRYVSDKVINNTYVNNSIIALQRLVQKLKVREEFSWWPPLIKPKTLYQCCWDSHDWPWKNACVENV